MGLTDRAPPAICDDWGDPGAADFSDRRGKLLGLPRPRVSTLADACSDAEATVVAWALASFAVRGHLFGGRLKFGHGRG